MPLTMSSTQATFTVTAKSSGSVPNTLTWQDLRVRPTALRPESPFFLEVWMDSDDAPSISFGAWHTHGDVYSWGSTDLDVQSDVILDALENILNDRIVLVCARTTEGKLIEWDRLEDITNLEKVEELLTDPDAPQELQVRSWSGKRDGPLAALLHQR